MKYSFFTNFHLKSQMQANSNIRHLSNSKPHHRIDIHAFHLSYAYEYKRNQRKCRINERAEKKLLIAYCIYLNKIGFETLIIKKSSTVSNWWFDLPFSFECQQVLFISWEIVANSETSVARTQRMLLMK